MKLAYNMLSLVKVLLMVMQDYTVMHRCISRNSYLITDNNRGEILCPECGSVVAEKTVDSQYGAPIPTSESYFTKTRVEGKSKISQYDFGLSTKIGKTRKDSSGIALSPKMDAQIKRMRLWDSRSKARNSRTLIEGFNFINGIKTKLALPDAISEKASYIFRKAVEKKILKGRSIESIALASIYAACRESGTPRFLDDLVKVSNVKKRALSSSYRHLLKNIELDLEIMDPKGFVSKVSKNLGINEKTARYARRILEKAHKKRITSGKRPAGLAGAAIYLASTLNGRSLAFREIEQEVNVSQHTLTKIVRLFLKNMDLYEISK